MSLNFIGTADSCVAEETPCYSNLSEVLGCFINHPDDNYSYQILDNFEKDNIKVETYILNSQKWPIDSYPDIESTIWKHKLSIYIPEVVNYKEAMLYVGGGYSSNNDGESAFSSSPEVLNYAEIAKSNNAVVVALEDVPNQFLFINNVYKKEDQILAYSYKKVMENPYKNAYLAGHLPMAKSIVKAMDATQEILLGQDIKIENFMLVGASKRGWAAWLAAIQDKRVSSLIPIVIDILNVQKNIDHICSSYQEYCPPALRDYKSEGITAKINTKEFYQLTQIEDPFLYKDLPSYTKQMSIPKYIINSSGDDFYAIDSSKFYFKALAGENYIRFFPQGMHYLAGNPLSNAMGNLEKLNEAVNNYFYFHLNNIKLPQVKWEFLGDKIIIDSSVIPKEIKLWTAENEDTRDFRCLHSYDKLNVFPKIGLAYLYKILSIEKSVCDTAFAAQDISPNCNQENCRIEIDTPSVKNGYQADFVELFYTINNRNFIITTEALVKPN